MISFQLRVQVRERKYEKELVLLFVLFISVVGDNVYPLAMRNESRGFFRSAAIVVHSYKHSFCYANMPTIELQDPINRKITPVDTFKNINS